MYFFRITYNLLNGTVSGTPFKWYAKMCVKKDRYIFLGLFAGIIGCDGYSAKLGIPNNYPAPNEIVKL